MLNSPKSHIFVVDDEPVIVSTLVAILNGSGFRATGFVNPFTALEASTAEMPDVLISDVMMPGMNGIDLAVQLKAGCPACRIVLFSGQAETARSLAAAKDDCSSFIVLTKPVHPTELLTVLSSFLGSSSSRSEVWAPGINLADTSAGIPFN